MQSPHKPTLASISRAHQLHALTRLLDRAQAADRIAAIALTGVDTARLVQQRAIEQARRILAACTPRRRAPSAGRSERHVRREVA